MIQLLFAQPSSQTFVYNPNLFLQWVTKLPQFLFFIVFFFIVVVGNLHRTTTRCRSGVQLPSLGSTSHSLPPTHPKLKFHMCNNSSRCGSNSRRCCSFCLPLPLCITNDFINFQITESQRPAEHFGLQFCLAFM